MIPNLEIKNTTIPKDGDSNPIFNPTARTFGEISVATAIESKACIIPTKNPRKPQTSPNKLKCFTNPTSLSDLSDFRNAMMIMIIHTIRIKRFEYINNGPPSLNMFANKYVIVFVLNDYDPKVESSRFQFSKMRLISNLTR